MVFIAHFFKVPEIFSPSEKKPPTTSPYHTRQKKLITAKKQTQDRKQATAPTWVKKRKVNLQIRGNILD